MSALGFALASFSAVFNGSFASAFKLPKVAAAGLDPLLFQLYVSLGVFLSSFLVIPFLSYNAAITGNDAAGTALVFEPLGLAAGGLFVLAISFSFVAVDLIGVALGQGVWGGFAILISYLWGVMKFGDKVATPWLAVLALLLLAVGVLGIAFCEPLGKKLTKSNSFQNLPEDRNDVVSPAMPGAASPSQPLGVGSFSVRDNSLNSADGATQSTSKNWLLGMFFAFCVGLSGGSILVPMHYVPDSSSGLAFVVSFGIGTMVSSPLVCLVCFGVKQKIPPLHLADTLWAGLLSGLIYNIGNVLQILAIPMIGFSLAGPLLQCALFVAGLWGIFVFKEIQGPAVQVFFLAGAVLISGAVCLAASS